MNAMSTETECICCGAPATRISVDGHRFDGAPGDGGWRVCEKDAVQLGSLTVGRAESALEMVALAVELLEQSFTREQILAAITALIGYPGERPDRCERGVETLIPTEIGMPQWQGVMPLIDADRGAA